MRDDVTSFEQYESALVAVGRLAGLRAKPSITVAKEALRRHGSHGAKLASRLSKLSKVRNGLGHPDVTLLPDILGLASGLHSADTVFEVVDDGDDVSRCSDAADEVLDLDVGFVTFTGDDVPARGGSATTSDSSATRDSELAALLRPAVSAPPCLAPLGCAFQSPRQSVAEPLAKSVTELISN